MMPSVEIATKIAAALEVSLDFLVGVSINSKFDKKPVQWIQDIEKLEPADKEHVFALIDAFLAKKNLKRFFNNKPAVVRVY